MRDKIREWIKKDQWAYGENGRKDDLPEALLGEAYRVGPSLEDRVIEQLKKDRFLNDENFAREWVSSRIRSKPRGESLLRMELAQKGIDRDLIDAILEELLKSNDEGSDTNAIYAMAYKTAQKYAHKLHESDHRAYVFKLKQALVRKGFEMSTINRVVDELLTEGYNSVD